MREELLRFLSEEVTQILNDKKILSENKTSIQVTEDMDLAGQLGLDSLDLIEITLHIEEKYVISIPEAELAKVLKVKDFIDLVVKIKTGV